MAAKKTTSKAATTTKAPVKQEHKTPDELKADTKKDIAFADVEGSELLKSFAKVKGSDQLRLIGTLMNMGLFPDDEDSEVNVNDIDPLKIADMIDYVSEKFAVDPDAFDQFTMGIGGSDRAMTLVMGYVNEMGKDDD